MATVTAHYCGLVIEGQVTGGDPSTDADPLAFMVEAEVETVMVDDLESACEHWPSYAHLFREAMSEPENRVDACFAEEASETLESALFEAVAEVAS